MLYSCCDLDALVANARTISALSKKKLIAVLKHDAYSCGIKECALALKDEVFAFAVENMSEAKTLRSLCLNKKIFLLAPIEKHTLFCELSDIVLPIDCIDIIDALNDIYIKQTDISLRVDLCGSGIGLRESDFETALQKIASTPSLNLFSVFVHCPSLYQSQDEEKIRAAFSRLCRRAKKLNRRCVCHLATSASWRNDALGFDALRLGTNLFGLPSFDAQDVSFLRPVLSLYSNVERILSVEGELSFYDCKQCLSRPTRLGIIGSGYGYLPALLDKRDISLLINGAYVKTVGSVYMGHLIVDLSEIEGVRVGDAAVFVGKSGGKEISALQFAKSVGVSPCRCEGSLFTTKSAQKIFLSNDNCILK